MKQSKEIVSVYLTPMIMNIIQFVVLKRWQLHRSIENTKKVYMQAYQLPISYNCMQQFIFVGMDDVLCYYLMRFMPQEINHFFPFLDFHKICFANRLEATPKEALAVFLIRLLS